MSDTFTNETGCEVSRSHMTGDIVCQRPGPDCDCLMSARPANGIHVSRIDDWAFITADGWALEDWAHRPGAHWPCSRLAMLPAGVHIETRNGDLIEIGPDPSMPYAMTDLRAYRDIPADEVSAFIDYALAT